MNYCPTFPTLPAFLKHSGRTSFACKLRTSQTCWCVCGQHKIKWKPPSLHQQCLICSAALSQAEFFLLLLQPRLFPRSSRTNLPFPAPLDQEEGWGSSAVSLHFLVGSVVNTGESWAVPVYVTEVLCPLRSPVLCFLLLCYVELQGAKQQSYGNKQQLPQRQR